MKNGKWMAAVCIAVILAGICLKAGAAGKTPAQALIERITVTYASGGERDEQALAALSAADPALGEKWGRIMDLWAHTVTVNRELPDGLPVDDTLCLVVLGFQLNPDGTMRGELIERLKTALAASEKYPQALIVCTGGGTAADDPSATEAGRMGEWLQGSLQQDGT